MVVGAAVVGVLGYPSLAAGPSLATAPVSAAPLRGLPHGSPHRERGRALGETDGVVPDGTTVFDDDEKAGDAESANHGSSQRSAALPPRLPFFICRRYAPALASEHAGVAR